MSEWIMNDERIAELERAAYERGWRDRGETDAAIAEQPYSDAVECYGYDEPLAVGAKIAAAIRALGGPPPEEADAP